VTGRLASVLEELARLYGRRTVNGVDRVVATKRTHAQWTGIVNRMVYLGAPITPDQMKTVLDYLNTNYGD